MPSLPAKLLIGAAHSVAKSHNGVGCGSTILVMQHLRNLCDKGKITFEQLEKCADYLDFAEDVALDDVDAIIKSLIPIIKHSKHKELVQKAIQDFGKGRDVSDAAAEFNKVASIGSKRASLGQGLLADEQDIKSSLSSKLDYPLPTGVVDLDIQLKGGLEKHALGMVVGPTGVGKSMFLSSLSVEALIEGYDVAYLTLELSESQVKRRIYSNLCDMTAEELIETPKKAAYRIRQWMAEGLGRFKVLYETGGATTPQHLRTWLRDLEQEEKFSPRLVVIDMADHLISEMGTREKSYKDQGDVYEQLRNIGIAQNGWTWTASHAKAAAEGKKKIRTNMAADSMNKPRKADLVIGLARTNDDELNNMIRFNVAKHREGEDHIEVGPMSRDMERGRITMITERVNPWEK